MNKILRNCLIGFGIFFGLLFLMGIFSGFIEDAPTETKYPKSEYTTCMEEVQKQMKEDDIKEVNYIKSYLEDKGYSDGIDCIMDSSKYSICDDIDRYNAEIDAINEFIVKYPYTGKSAFDCLELAK